jgi:hypothetical protein
VNRTGVPGSPAKRCAVNPVAFKSPAFPMGDETTRWWSPSGKAGEGREVLRFEFSFFRPGE